MEQEYLVWTDEEFIGIAQTADGAVRLAHRQPKETTVYACDFNAAPDTQFCVISGNGRIIGRLGIDNLLRGLSVAQRAFAKGVTASRDRMLKTRATIGAKYPLGLPSLDSPPNPDWETWRRVGREFEEAKHRNNAFCERYSAISLGLGLPCPRGPD